MSRPRPLDNLSSARSGATEFHSLTPRTPHTARIGRAEEGYTEVELADDDELEEYRNNTQLQGVPLLSSSASDNFPSSRQHSRGNELVHRVSKDFHGWKSSLDAATIVSRIPIVAGSILAGLLFFLSVVAYQRPGTLERYIGAAIPGSKNPSFSTPDSTPDLLISYENYTQFPLLPTEYVSECYKLNQGWMNHGDLWDPPMNGTKDVVHASDDAVCSSTITYMLDGRIGLVSDLALMAQAAALARERNRTFLVDDTYWNRGKWTDHFLDIREMQPGPEPGCKAPPPEELVACPRLARHWVINSHTAKFHFGHAFSDQYEDPYARNLNRMKPMFIQASESLAQTIRPSEQNAALIRSARAELVESLSLDGEVDTFKYVGVHIRRGDRKTSFNTNHYVPIPDFVDAVSETWTKLGISGTSVSYVASDSPSIANEFKESLGDRGRAFALIDSENDEAKSLASPNEYFQKDFNEMYELEERIALTRGMVVDLALISGLWQAGDLTVVPEAVVCTITSAICKLSAVAFGWEKAFGQVDEMGYVDRTRSRWVEIDERGQIIPAWTPFNLF